MRARIRRWNRRHLLWLLLILVTAVSLRLYHIREAPPGLTHDEADHGITAWGILQGEGGIYFPVGYGREPLYDYATAAVMAVMGPTYLAGRLTAVFFSLLTIVGLYAWTCRAFDRTTALLAAVGLAVSFWGVMAARQSLRSITLPALFVLALWLWWRESGEWQVARGKRQGRKTSFIIHNSLFIIHYFLSGIFLGLTFYTYIPARIMWLLFPAILVYLAIVDRDHFKLVWKGTAVTLLIASLIALPLILFLLNNPELEVRIAELSGPLTAVSHGDFSLLWQNAKSSLRLFTVAGDTTWRYNIPGKPFLPLVQGTLFYVGLLLAGWWVIRPLRKNSTPQQKQRGAAAFAALAWLLLGIAPVLVTGPELSMTQAMGMQPVMYVFPALVLGQLKTKNGKQKTKNKKRTAAYDIPLTVYWLLITIFFTGIAYNTARDYFGTWVNAPEVRVQYESTMVAAMDYVNTHDVKDVAISTITPGEFHTPALAQMMLTNTPVLSAAEVAVLPRWYDGRTSLLLPQAEESVVIVPGFTPMHPALGRYVNTRATGTTLPLRDTDLDRPLNIYEWRQDETLAEWQTIFTMEDIPVNFGDKLQ
ncbi:MAG: glycosyltransferase family 39 protein, partial [Anaerolineales bacterium]|nr:glycosyltransferase family 39 protein [Anaerolineales bacterium]